MKVLSFLFIVQFMTIVSVGFASATEIDAIYLLQPKENKVYTCVQNLIEPDQETRTSLIVKFVKTPQNMTFDENMSLIEGLHALLTENTDETSAWVKKWRPLGACNISFDTISQETSWQQRPQNVLLNIAKFIPLEDTAFYQTCKIFYSVAGLRMDPFLVEIKNRLLTEYHSNAFHFRSLAGFSLSTGDPIYDALHPSPDLFAKFKLKTLVLHKLDLFKPIPRTQLYQEKLDSVKTSGSKKRLKRARVLHYSSLLRELNNDLNRQQKSEKRRAPR